MRECRSLIVRSISLLRLIKRAAECNPMAQSPSFTNVSANSRMKQDQFVKNGDHAKALIMDQSLNHSWIDMKGMNYAVALKFTNCSIPRTGHSVKPLTEEDHRVRSSFSYQTNALFNITNAANRKIKTYNQKIDNFIKYFSAFRRLSFLIQRMGECCFIGEIRKSEVRQLHFLNAPWRPTILWSMSF